MGRAAHQPSAVIDEMFPSVQWNGASEIHRSIYRNVTLDFTMGRNPGSFIRTLKATEFALMVYEELQEQFAGCEWLVNHEEFEQLMLTEYWLALSGEPLSVSPQMIRNPRTGNVFHRMAVKDGLIVCGIRFWASKGQGRVTIGFRFRIAVMGEGEEVKARKQADESKVQTAVAYTQLVSMVDLTDITEEEQAEARKRLKVEEEE